MRQISLIILLLLPLIPSANAQLDSAGTGSCSYVRALDNVNAGQTAIASINIDQTTIINCNTLEPFITIPAGSSFTIYCNQFASPATTVLVPESLTINLVEDNDNFGSNTPTSVRTINANACIGGATTFTAACTTNGVAGGSPAYGIFRIHIRETRTTVPTYDVNSDDGGTPPSGGSVDGLWGIIRCEAGLTTLTESNPQTTYQPEDTIGVTFTVNATPLQASNNGNAWVKCGPTANNLGNNFPTTASKSNTATIVGSLTLWPDDCTNTLYGWQFTSFSAISGWTTTRLAIFNGSTPAGVTFNAGKDNATLTTTDTIDRTITQVSSCEYHINASASVVTQVEILEGVTSHCHNGWTYARGTSIPNNQAGRGFTVRTQPPVVTDYPSVDFLTGGGGSTTWTAISVTNPTLGTYHGAIQTFSTTARTEAVLLGIGNITQTFTLTNVRTFDAIINAKTSGGANESVFILANDQQFVSARALRNVRGELLSGVNVVCQRTKPDATVETAVNMGNTDASGHTAFVEFQVIAPAGQWTTVCTSTAAGNTASYTIRYFHVSPFTADTNVVIEWQVNATGRLTIAGGIHSVKIGESTIEQDFFDDPSDVSYEVVARACDGCPWWSVVSGKLIQAGTNPYWQTNVTLPTNYTSGGYLHIHVWGNFTGRMFLGTAQVTTTETVFDMTTFFDAQPVKILPILILLGFAIWGLNKASNKYTGLSFALCNLLGVFAIAGSKSYYESLNVGTYIAGFGVVGLLAISVLTLVKSWEKPAV